MISQWFENPHKLHRPYNFGQVREVSAPQRRGLSDLDITDLPLYSPGVDYTTDILTSSWAATLGQPGATVTKYAGPGIPNPTATTSGISPMLLGVGLIVLIMLSGGHSRR